MILCFLLLVSLLQVNGNEALEELLTQEEQTVTTLYATGQLYEQHGQSALAVLSYEKALLLSPQDSQVKKSLTNLRKREGIPPPPSSSFLLSFSKGSWWLLTTLLLLSLCTTLIWKVAKRPKERPFSAAVFLLGIATLLSLLMLFSRQWLLPPRAVVLKATQLYAQSSLQESLDRPLIAAEVVKVIGSGEESFEILTKEEILGYVPKTAIAPIYTKNQQSSIKGRK